MLHMNAIQSILKVVCQCKPQQRSALKWETSGTQMLLPVQPGYVLEQCL